MPLRLILAGLLACLWAGSIPPLLGTGVIHHAPVAHADGPGDWPMFGHDPGGTGYGGGGAPVPPPSP